MNQKRKSSRRVLYTNLALSGSTLLLLASGSMWTCPSRSSETPPMCTMWLTVPGASSSQRSSWINSAKSVIAEQHTIVSLCPVSRDSLIAENASSWPLMFSSSESGARYDTSSILWAGASVFPASEPFATRTSCAPSAIAVPFASRARWRLSPKFVITDSFPTRPVRRRATAIASAFSSSRSFPKSPTINISMHEPTSALSEPAARRASSHSEANFCWMLSIVEPACPPWVVAALSAWMRASVASMSVSVVDRGCFWNLDVSNSTTCFIFPPLSDVTRVIEIFFTNAGIHETLGSSMELLFLAAMGGTWGMSSSFEPHAPIGSS
mmetsp:Transcript_43414/g.98085  ORF Transcript_43414/g.98085 Transcript_43414/m.98085 type:complete len:324 (+) Transcript_43414:3187-4158(+)